jgi:hypothetical protein
VLNQKPDKCRYRNATDLYRCFVSSYPTTFGDDDLSNVTQFPGNDFNEMVRDLTEVDFDTIARLFIFAMDRRLSTQPLVELIKELPRPLKPSAKQLDNFVGWCSGIDFVSNSDRLLSPTDDQFVGTSSIPDHVLKFAAEIGNAANNFDEYARVHKYWFFRPALEVDSALWSNFFADDDPAAVIAFYASSFFKRRHEHLERRSLNLKKNDVDVLEWIIDEAVADICSRKGTKAEYLRPAIKGVIATACRLEKVVAFASDWTSPDFLTGFAEAPNSVAISLLDYWGERIDFASEMVSSELQQLAVRQAHTMAASLLSYFAPSIEAARGMKRRLPFVSDRTIVSIHDKISVIEIEADADSLKPILRVFAEAIYEARETFFGGVFPFSIHDANNIIGCLAHEDGMWLADISYYTSWYYDRTWDMYAVYSAEKEDHRYSGADIRINLKAYNRYQAYRSVLVQMEKDGQKELARAWWAFFIGSQAKAFVGLGMPCGEFLSFASLTESLLPDRFIAKSLDFAILQESQRTTSAASRSCLAMLRGLATSNDQHVVSKSARVINLVVSHEQIEGFLRDQLDLVTWERLSDESRRDLIEAEQLWCRASPDLGIRVDWGSLIALYARPLEAEARASLGPIIEQLHKLDLCTVKELTFGGCFDGIMQAKKTLRTRKADIVPEPLRSRLFELHAFLANEGAFLRDLRNRADHASRDKPVRGEEFVRWRRVIFHDRIFSVLLGTELILKE